LSDVYHSGNYLCVRHFRSDRRPAFFIPARVGNAFAIVAVSMGAQMTPSKSQTMRSRGSFGTAKFAQTNMKTKAFLALTMLIICATAVRAGGCDWKAPPTAANRPNPVPANANTIALGQKLFAANCQTCHGESGKGDGPGGAALEKKPADLGACIKANNETDGSLFWKISEGRSPMVSWKGALSETQRWELVNYIKTLAGK
jgi:mono/diheme cytochrome c family protein